MVKSTTELIVEQRDRLKYFDLFKVHSDLLINNNTGNIDKIMEIEAIVNEIRKNLVAMSNAIYVNKHKIMEMCRNLQEKYGNEVAVFINEIEKLPLQVRK